MKKEDKSIIIAQIQETLKAYSHFYLTEAQGLNAEQVSKLRRMCNKQEVKMLVVKNTLLKKALEQNGFDVAPLAAAFKENTAVLFSNTGNAPAKLIKEFSKEAQKPVLKAAYVEEGLYVGSEHLNTLVAIKSKNELIGDIIGLLQSPIRNIVSALQNREEAAAEA